MKNFILFDFDDTLVDTFNTRSKAIKSAAKKYYNLELSIDAIQEAWGMPFRELFIELFGDVDEIGSIIDNYMRHVKSFPNKTFPGVLGLLKNLKEENYLGLVTAAD